MTVVSNVAKFSKNIRRKYILRYENHNKRFVYQLPIHPENN